MDYNWLTDDDPLTHFIKPIECILGKVKEGENPYVQGYQSYEKDLVLREGVLSRTESTSVIDTGNDWDYSPIGKVQKNSSSDNIQEIPVSMKISIWRGPKTNLLHLQVWTLCRYLHARSSNCIMKYPHQFDPLFGSAI